MLDNGIPANVINYNAVIDACAKAREVDKAGGWLTKMLEQGSEADVVSYTVVIVACAKVGLHERAHAWLE